MGTVTEVVIDGKIYKLSGNESDLYMQQVAAYLNAKIGELKQSPAYGRLSEDYQRLMLEINIADDYFAIRKELEEARKEAEEREREAYSAKHDLVALQMKLEAVKNKDAK